MIKRYNNLSLALGIPGIILQVVGNVYLRLNEGTALAGLGVLVMLAGTGLLIAGLAYYAVAKGRSGWWGLCGFLSIIGLIVLALLKDHAPQRTARSFIEEPVVIGPPPGIDGTD